MKETTNYSLNANLLERYLQKDCHDFTKSDIIRYCIDNNVMALNLHYCGWDGKLHTLNFAINSVDHLDTILSAGERVDGSSLFPFIKAGRSDLYIMPKYRTAFVNPFTDVPTIDLLCSYFDRDCNPFESSPECILHKAHQALERTTGLKMQAMAELEYYVIDKSEDLYTVEDQKGYHQSSPFNKHEAYRVEAMRMIAQAGGKIKYGHSEVGNFTLGNTNYEQNEIEFLPVNLEDAADQIAIAKWIMREAAYRHGLSITFAPKIAAGNAGSGMHIHCKLTRDGKQAMTADGALTEECRKAIAGLMIAGTSLPAFGNPHPLSYFRLVPHQEAPTSLCWSFSNRSALVRVPLGWLTKTDMVKIVNPVENDKSQDFSSKQTFEWRASDGYADIYMLMAALCCAIRCGFETSDALKIAEKTFVDLGLNIHDEANKALADSLKQLPDSCVGAAEELEKYREIYSNEGVFSESILDYTIKNLRQFADTTLRKDLSSEPAKVMKLVSESINLG